MSSIHPYLNFDDTCEAAFQHYRSIFGGEFASMMRFEDGPEGFPYTEEEASKIMHIALPIGEHTILMGSDRSLSTGKTKVGDNFSISYSADSREEADRIFQQLSEGGQITMPISQTFWGAYFGMLTDAFGINWMISYDENFQ